MLTAFTGYALFQARLMKVDDNENFQEVLSKQSKLCRRAGKQEANMEAALDPRTEMKGSPCTLQTTLALCSTPPNKQCLKLL